MYLRATSVSLFLLQLSPLAFGRPAEQKPLKDAVLDSALTVRAELKKAEIIPTVIDDFTPSLSLSVSWDKDSASLGNTIKPKHVQDEPTIEIHDETNTSPGCATKNLTYVITLTDPDAPSRDDPKWSEMCHWIAAGVPLASEKKVSVLPWFGVQEEKVDGIEQVIEYKPPGPPPKTGKHRYVFLVFAPSNGTSQLLHLTKPKDRQHWGSGEERQGVRQWAEENGLTPVAANFIYSQNKKQ